MVAVKLSMRQLVSMMVLYLVGSAVIVGGSFESRQDTWISCIIGVLMVIPLILAYSRVSTLFRGESIFDIFYILFGKVGGRVFTVIFTFYAVQLAALVIRNFTVFIQITAFPETPQLVVAIFIGITCYLVVKHPINLMGRGCVWVFPVIVLSITITVVLLIKNMHFSNIRPILASEPSNLFAGAFAFLAFPFGEIVLFMGVTQHLEKTESVYKAYFKTFAIGGIIMTVVVIRNILVLGVPTMIMMKFPSYQAATIISIGDSITRVEVIIGANFVIGGVAKICICLYVGSKGISKLFKIDDNKKVISSITFLAVAVSGYIFNNSLEMFDFITVYRYYSPLFQVVIPIITWIFAEKYCKKQKGLKPKNEYIACDKKIKIIVSENSAN